jgi:hypothetical protein
VVGGQSLDMLSAPVGNAESQDAAWQSAP